METPTDTHDPQDPPDWKPPSPLDRVRALAERCLAGLAAIPDHRLTKVAQGVVLLITALLLVAGLLGQLGLIRVEPHGLDELGHDADKDVREGILQAPLFQRAIARTACDAAFDDELVGSALSSDQLAASALLHADLQQIAEYERRLDSWLGHMLPSTDTYAWRTLALWQLAHTLEPATNAPVRARQVAACRGLARTDPMTSQSILLSLAVHPERLLDQEGIDTDEDACVGQRKQRLNQISDHIRISPQIVIDLGFWSPRIGLGWMPMPWSELPMAAADAREARADDAFAQAVAVQCQETQAAPPQVDPLSLRVVEVQDALGDMGGQIDGIDAKLLELSAAMQVLVSNVGRCGKQMQEVRVARRDFLSRAFGAPITCTEDQADNPAYEPATDTFVTEALTLGPDTRIRVPCRSVCEFCGVQYATVSRGLSLDLLAAQFDECDVEKPEENLVNWSPLADQLTSHGVETVTLVGWADKQTPLGCPRGTSNADIALRRAVYVGERLKDALEDDGAIQLPTRSSVQPRADTTCARGDDACFARFRRVDMSFAGGKLDFNLESCM